MRRTLPLALCFLGLLVIPPAADTVAYVSQNRYVDASGFASESQGSDSDAESHSASGFDPFSEAASAATSIAFAAAPGGAADVRIFDVQGSLVADLGRGPAANGVVTWDGRDSHGTSVPVGVYFVRAQRGAVTGIAKVVRSR